MDSSISSRHPIAGEIPKQALIQSIRNWLLGSQAQLPDGPHRGGVAGWLNEMGAPAFLYAEAMGYYLTWLAFLREISHGDAALPHATSALRWISDRFAGGTVPPTRLYLEGCAEDWRNNVIFSFDLAMLSRGIAVAPSPADGRHRAASLAKVLDCLNRFIDSDRFIRPCLNAQRRSATPLPERWSLAAGPHQLKVAAAIFALPPDAVGGDLAVAAHKLFWHWRKRLLSARPVGDTHPILYSLEGLVLAGAHGRDEGAWQLAARLYSRLMEAQLTEGGLPSCLNDTCTPPRSDVLAQALRVGSILRSRNCLNGSGWEERLASLATALRSFVQNDGSVQFCREGKERHRNTWCALFSHQAFCFYELLSTGQAIPEHWLKLLI